MEGGVGGGRGVSSKLQQVGVAGRAGEEGTRLYSTKGIEVRCQFSLSESTTALPSSVFHVPTMIPFTQN